MNSSQIQRATAAAVSVVQRLGLPVDETVVLHDSNKLTLVVLPADLVARVAPVEEQNAEFEVEIAGQLARLGAPVATLDPRNEPRVHEEDGFVITLWTHYPTGLAPIGAAAYADALAWLHHGMRSLTVATPDVTDRIGSAERLVSDRDLTPTLPDEDRALLTDTLRGIGGTIARRGRQQVLHGEPHPGNLLATVDGPRFIDFETCCRGPVEFDLAHAPEDVVDHYPGVDHALLADCRMLMLAMIIAWRWDPGDQLPHGRERAAEWTDQLRAAWTDRPGGRA